MFKLNKSYNKTAAYAALHKQVLGLLLKEGRIIRKSRGIYEINKPKPIIQTQQSEADLIAEEKWKRLSSSGFNPDSLLTKDTLGRIKK
jgi:hypothetical protein